MRRRRSRGNGDGSIVRVARPGRALRYAAVLVVGWTPEGLPIRRARYASSEKAARALLADMLEARADARPLPDDRLTVGKWLVDWLGRQSHLRPTTREQYDRFTRTYLLPAFGTIPLRRLTPAQVTTMLDALSARGLAAHTVAGVRNVLSTALKDAIREGHISRNAAALARAPRLPGQVKPAPSPEDVRAVLAELEGHRLADLYVVLATTGLRLGEVLGLRWEDRTGDTIAVRHQLQRIEGEYVLTDPKSERSRRAIVLPPVAVRALDRQRARQAEERLAAGRRWREADLVFATVRGQPTAPTTVEWVLAQACKRAGVRHISPHDLRRFVATVVAGTGDLKGAQALLGHTSAGLTADVYASGTEAALRRAASVLEEAIG